MVYRPTMSDLASRIRTLVAEKNAIILVHNYQLPEVQDIGDFVGDSFGLAVKASEADADVIIFCGVNFMAESALILNPGKLVLHPEPESRCPMAAMANAESLELLKSKHPTAAVVSYVNTTAEVKAGSDICCTSSNAAKVCRSLPNKKIIFTPDVNLGSYVARQVPEKEMILWPGYCDTHQNRITLEDLRTLRELHPEAEIIVHPECTPEVIDYSDRAFSTAGMISHCMNSDRTEFIIGTERDMVYRLRKDIPGKTFYAIDKAVCPNMKKITLKKVLASLETLSPKVELPEDIMQKARIPLERMVAVGRGE